MNKATIARIAYGQGKITREEAINQITPYIEHANKKGKEIAKRYGTYHRSIDMLGFLR